MKRYLILLFIIMNSLILPAQNGILVFQTDFGLKDGAVSAMKGVAVNVSGEIRIFDITHEIPAFNVWEAAYRLEQTARYWPAGTVFVSVVDPGVGSDRKSIVAKTKTGHYIVTPDNGTLTLVANSMGIEEVRVIDEKINRLPGSGASNTFHGRDVFGYTGAKLAAKKISFQQVGPVLQEDIVMILFQKPQLDNKVISGNIPVLDIQYGNAWTNIPDKLINELEIKYGDSLEVTILHEQATAWKGMVPFVKTFTGVHENQSLAYINSLLNLALAINKGDFARQYKINSGPAWKIMVRKK